MATFQTETVFRAAADVFGAGGGENVGRVARGLACHADLLQRRFLARLRKAGFGEQVRKPLAAITIGSAAAVLAAGRTLDDFFEIVEYNGRRLAKLDVQPEALRAALQQYKSLIEDVTSGDAPEGRALSAACEQLGLLIGLKLNQAFYEIRDAEARCFYDLFEAELEAPSERELLDRFGEALKDFCRAEQGRIVFGGPFSRAAQRPCYVEKKPDALRILVEKDWIERYQSFWSVPIGSKGLAGVMQFAFSKPYRWLPRELRMLETAAERCLRAREKWKLIHALELRETQVRELAARLEHVEEGERRRISRELHDESGQLLMCLRLQLEMLENSTPESCLDLKPKLAQARQLAERTIVETRRLLSDLSPEVLEQLGLAAAVRQLAKRLREYRNIRPELDLQGLEALDAAKQRLVYRLLQECCNNAGKHSSATRIRIRTGIAGGELVVDFQDDGAGFKLGDALAKAGCSGLSGMRERVALAGGRFEIASKLGQGTRISIRLPLRSPAAGKHCGTDHISTVRENYAKDSHSARG